MLIQNKIIVGASIITAAIGAYANFIARGPGSAITFLTVFAIVVYLAAYQVYCLLVGSCRSSAWIVVGMYLATMFGIAAAYLIAIKNKETTLNNAKILDANYLLGKSINYTQDIFKYKLID